MGLNLFFALFSISSSYSDTKMAVCQGFYHQSFLWGHKGNLWARRTLSH